MKAVLLFIAAASAVKPPVISLDLSASYGDLHTNTSMWSSSISVQGVGHELGFGDQSTTNTYGLHDTKAILYKHAQSSETYSDGHPTNPGMVSAIRDLTLRCIADQEGTASTCKLPTAQASDHHDASVVVRSRIYHVRNNTGGAVGTSTTALQTTSGNAYCGDDTCIETTLTAANAYTQRGAWLVRYDATDASGNRAQQLVVAITFDDPSPPEFTLPPISTKSGTELDELKCNLNSGLEAYSTEYNAESTTDYLCHALTGRKADGNAITNPYEETNLVDTRDHEAAFDNVATDDKYSVSDTIRYDVKYKPIAGVAYWSGAVATDNQETNGETFCTDCTATALENRLGATRTKVGTFVITVKVHDHAGVYGNNAENNVNSYTRTVTVTDAKIPTITLRKQTDLDSSEPSGDDYAPNCASQPGVNTATPLGAKGECCTDDACATVYQQCGYNYNDNYATAADDLDDQCTAMESESTKPTAAEGTPSGTYALAYQCKPADTEWQSANWLATDYSSSDLEDAQLAMTTGQYTITYMATDNSGNDANNVTRTVHVIDTERPAAELYPSGSSEVVHFSKRSASDPKVADNPTDFTKYRNGSRADAWMQPGNLCNMTTSTVAGYDGKKEVDVSAQDTNAHSCTEPGIQCFDMCDSPQNSAVPANLIVTAEWTHFTPHTSAPSSKTARDCDSDNPCDYDDRVIGTYRRTYTCTDLSGNTHTISRDFVNADKDKPYIELNDDLDGKHQGDGISRYEADGTGSYSEPGAVCMDWHRHDADGYDPNDPGAADADHKIDSIDSHTWTGAKTGSNSRLQIEQVNPSTLESGSYPATDLTTPGTYVVKYTCTDHAGNVADAKYRTVIVVDDIKPTLTLKTNTNTCLDANTCYQEAGFKWTDPGVEANDPNNMDTKYPVRPVTLTVTFQQSHSGTDYTDSPASDVTGVNQLQNTVSNAVATNGQNAYIENPLVGKYIIQYNVEDYFHYDPVTPCNQRTGSPNFYQQGTPSSPVCACSNTTTGISCNKADTVTRTLIVTDTLRPVITLHDADDTMNPAPSNPFHTSNGSDTRTIGDLTLQNPAGKNVAVTDAYTPSKNPNLSLMAEQSTSVNGWVLAGVASAVAGIALLAKGSNKRTTVPV